MISPPKWPFKLLSWFCKPWYVEQIEGDLMELFYRDGGGAKARWKLIFNTIRFFRWRYIKDLEDFQPKTSVGMFKTYFKVSSRNMLKHKWQTFLNIFGLAVGLASCMLMLVHVRYQLKVDKHIPELNRIYRVTLNEKGRYTPALLINRLLADYPEVIQGTRVNGPVEATVKIGDNYVKIPNGIWADSTFFELFPAEFVAGDASKALSGPHDVVLTETLAKSLFPNVNAVGQIIETDAEKYVVTAVVRNNTKSTTLPYDYVASIPWESWATKGWWTGNNFYSYIKLNQQSDAARLQAKLPDFVEKYVGPEMLSFYSEYESFDDYLADGHDHLFRLVPMRDIHLHHPHLSIGTTTSYNNLVIFSLVAIFILVLACINYINMATARSSLRAREIGMRKVMGSIRQQIAGQFLTEAFFVTFLAVVLGIGLAILILPYFNNVSQFDYHISDILQPSNLVWFFVTLIITSLISGSYPAFYLSSIQPISALKGALTSGHSWVRSGLVMFQFAISLFLMVATFIVYLQLHHISNRDLGLQADNVYVMSGALRMEDHYPAFKDQLLSHSGIASVGRSNSFPSSFVADWNYHTIDDNSVKIAPFNFFVSGDIKDVWGLKLVEGRFFDNNLVTDTANIVVNAKLVKEVGWGDPIGQVLTRGGEEGNFRVIGVVENFEIEGAKRSLEPVVMRFVHNDRNDFFRRDLINIKIKGDVLPAIAHIEEVWNQYNSGYPIDGVFMDDSFQRLYDDERRFSMLFTGFSVLAIIIACLGLYSLASFVLENRRKEIAIRKVLGARVLQIFTFITYRFGKLILLSALVALPLAFYLGDMWLGDYVYRISLGWWVFLIPLILLLVIAVFTITYQTLKTAQDNPVNALKEE